MRSFQAGPQGIEWYRLETVNRHTRLTPNTSSEMRFQVPPPASTVRKVAPTTETMAAVPWRKPRTGLVIFPRRARSKGSMQYRP